MDTFLLAKHLYETWANGQDDGDSWEDIKDRHERIVAVNKDAITTYKTWYNIASDAKEFCNRDITTGR